MVTPKRSIWHISLEKENHYGLDENQFYSAPWPHEKRNMATPRKAPTKTPIAVTPRPPAKKASTRKPAAPKKKPDLPVSIVKVGNRNSMPAISNYLFTVGKLSWTKISNFPDGQPLKGLGNKTISQALLDTLGDSEAREAIWFDIWLAVQSYVEEKAYAVKHKPKF